MLKSILAAVGAGFICFKIYEVGYKRGLEAASITPVVRPAASTDTPTS